MVSLDRVTKAATVRASKPAPETAPVPLTVEEIDELITLKRELAPEQARLKPKVDRVEALTRRLRACHESDPGDKTFTAAGTEFDLLIGQKREEATPDRKRIYKFFGVRDFVDAIASITQAAVKEALKRKGKPEAGAEAFFTRALTGWREVSVVAKSPAPPASAEKKAA